MSLRLLGCAAIVLLLSMMAAELARGALPQQSGTVDLLSEANVQIDGAAAGDWAGLPVAGAGDVNGDGRADVIVGAGSADNNGRDNSGSAYVVLGQSSQTTLDLASLGPNGFRIDGAAADDLAGFSVAGAGDVNGDGRADVVIGAFWADNNGRSDSGSAYVVFGKSSTATVDLASLGSGGFRIDGAAAGGWAGASVAGAGDLSGDGRPDVIVGAFMADNNGRSNSGSAYVVFGKSSSATVDLASLGSGGFRIDGAAAGDVAGESVAGTGDVNGDGRADVAASASGADNNGRAGSGSAYVVFGKSSTTTVDLASLGSGGFRIDGAAASDDAGSPVAGAGDVNGDGRADAIIGAHVAGNNGRLASGSAYVVFGKSSTTTVDLASLGSGGFRIDGAASNDFAGGSVAGAGDVNGDGRPDVAVGARYTDNNGRADSGSAYVVFGKSSTTTIDLASLGSTGFRIDGAAAGDRAGESVAGTGDVNGDGRPDVAVGARYTDNNGRADSGSAYVMYGFGAPALAYATSSAVGTIGTPISSLVPTFARTGVPAFSVSPALPAGLALDPSAGVVSGTPTAAQAQTTHTVTMTDLAGSANAQLTVQVSSAGGGDDDGYACKRLSRIPAMASVSRWKRLRRGGRARLRGPGGGLVLRGGKRAVFRVQAKGARGRRGRIKQVTFALDGKRIAVDRRRPFRVSLTPSEVKLGRHTLTATGAQRGKRTRLRYRFFAANCRRAKFSVAMSSKRRRAMPNLRFTASSGGPQMEKVSFSLPRGLKVAARRGARGKRAGTVRLRFRSGSRLSLALRMPKRVGKRLVLLRSGSLSVTLRARSRGNVIVSGLPEEVTQVSVRLLGKKVRLFRNPRRCLSLRYRAKLTDTTSSSITLGSSARVC